MSIYITGCEKDTLVNIEKSSETDFVKYNWNNIETHFFDIANSPNNNSISLRGIEDSFPQLLQQVYNQIALENDKYNFVDALTQSIGVPFWTYSFVYQDNDINEGSVVIPFGFKNGDKVEAILVGSKSQQFPDDKIYFEFVLRKDVENAVIQNNVQNSPNLKLQIANFIHDDFVLYEKIDSSLIEFVHDNLESLNDQQFTSALELRDDECEIYKIMQCIWLGEGDISNDNPADDYNNSNSGSDGGNNNDNSGGDGSGFGWDPNGGWTTPAGGKKWGDLNYNWFPSGGSGEDSRGNDFYSGYKGRGGGLSLWDKFLNWFFCIIYPVKCAPITHIIVNKNIGTKIDYVNNNHSNKLELRNEDDWDCTIYYHKVCFKNGEWWERPLDIDEQCDMALENFIFEYGLELSQQEQDNILEQIGGEVCLNQEKFDKEAKIYILSEKLDLALEEKNWLENHTDVLDEIFEYSIKNTYPSEALNYFVWAMNKHGGTLSNYTDAYDQYTIDVAYNPPNNTNIEILSSYVPTHPPYIYTKLAQTPYREGHLFDPPNTIPYDLQAGTDGDCKVLSKIPNRLKLCSALENDLLTNFNELLHSSILNSDLQNVATSFYNRFIAREGGEYFNLELNNYVLNNAHTIATVNDFGTFLNTELKKVDGKLENVDWKKFGFNYRPIYGEGERTTGLMILMDDTETMIVYSMGDYEINKDTKE